MLATDSKQEKSAHERGEILEREREALEERSDWLRLEFINSELDLATTFCRIAASTRDADKSRRNLAHAEEAYSSARRFLKSSTIRGAMRAAIQSKLSELESLLSERHAGLDQ